jgi:hypothetical protein
MGLTKIISSLLILLVLLLPSGARAVPIAWTLFDELDATD